VLENCIFYISPMYEFSHSLGRRPPASPTIESLVTAALRSASSLEMAPLFAIPEIFVVQPTEAHPACLLDRRKVNENVLAGGSLSFPDQLSLPTEG
jgi:hypothetical protein